MAYCCNKHTADGGFLNNRITTANNNLPQSYLGEYVTDSKFTSHFKNLKQVFMYITEKCNLSCEQCIYKPSVNHYIKEEIDLDDAVALLKTFYKLGASKVTFLGGEPTLYGHSKDKDALLVLIEKTKNIGFEYIRLDTNGQDLSYLLDNNKFKYLNELAFSLDGYSPETNDELRGNGTFDKAVSNIKQAVKLGYRVTITTCAHRKLLERDVDGIFGIEQMISYAEHLGVSQINFHDLFKAGVPMDTWTGSFNPSVEQWVAMYNEVSLKIKSGQYKIDIRLPQCFVEEQEFTSNSAYYGYCPAKMGERVMVHPNGTIRICSNLICTGFGVGRYEKRRIYWDNTSNNELAGHNLNCDTPCTNRSRHRKYGKYVPLCFSFKPNQKEHVWQEKLSWDKKKC